MRGRVALKSACPEDTIPELSVTRFDGILPEKTQLRHWHICGVNPGHDVVLFNKGVENLTRGAIERVLRLKGKDGRFSKPPQPRPGIVEERLGDFRNRVLQRLHALPAMTRQQFVDCYTGHRKVRMQHAADSLDERPLDHRDAMCRIFVKVEPVMGTYKDESDLIPRIISPRDPRFNVEAGRRLKHAEHPLYRAIGQVWGGITVAKGFNCVQVANIIADKFDKFVDCAVVGLDASRFDQHFSVPTLSHEHTFYNRWLNDPQLAELLQQQLYTKCVGLCKDGLVKYTTNGGRMSGDMNTAMGNCVIMCNLVYAYAKARKVKCSLLNNGDDCIVFMRGVDVNKFNHGLDAWFLELGFNMKVEPAVYEIEKIEFCQMHPIKVQDGYIMVRNPDVSLAKDSVSRIPVGTIEGIHTWCNQVGVGGYNAYPDIPVISALYKSYAQTVPSDRLGKARSEWELTGLQRMLAGVKRHGDILPETRCSFYVAFGILPHVQIELESYYSSLVIGPEVVCPTLPMGTTTPSHYHAPYAVQHLVLEATKDKLNC